MATARIGRSLRALVGIIGLVVLGALGPALPASAHAGLASSDPTAGTVLPTAPRTVQLTFNEPVAPVADGFALYDSSGRHTVDGAPSTVTVTSLDTVVTAELPPSLAEGSYLLSWRTISADSHPISGVLAFAVGQASASAPVAPAVDAESLSSSVNSTYLALQVLGYLGLLGAVGLRVFDTLVLSPVAGSARTRSRLLALGAGLAVAAYALLVGVTSVRETGGRLRDLGTAAPWQQGLASPAVATLALAAVGAALLLVAPRLPRTAGRGLALAGALVAVTSVLPTGHTRTYTPQWLVVGLDLVHAGTAAVWFGGLIGLGLHLVRSRRAGSDPVAVAGVVARFSALAGVLVGLLGLSGAVMAVLIVGDLRTAFTTDYGHALMVKLALVAVIGLLAVWNRAYLVKVVTRRPSEQAQWRRLRSAVVDEAALVVVALAVTGLLTMQSPTAPAEGPGSVAAQRAAAGTALQRAELGTGTLQGQLQPAAVGVNAFEFTLQDSSGAPMTPPELPEVTASLPSAGLGPLTAAVEKLDGPNRYRAELPLPVGGQWQLQVAVRLSSYDGPVAVLDIPVVD